MEPAGRNPFGQMPLQEPVFKTTKQPPKLPDSNTSRETSSGPPKLPGETPFTANQLQADQIKLQVESNLPVSEVKVPTPTPAISKQIEIINSVMKVGIITKLRAKELGIGIIQSADRDQRPSDSLCLNYVHSNKGYSTSLIHPAKGGIPVLLEREFDPLANSNPSDPNFSKELSERAHCSMLFILIVEKVGEYDAELNLVKANGKEAVDRDRHVPVSPNFLGCMETRANGTVTPDNFLYLILPESLRPYKDALKIDPEKIKFVGSIEVENIPYNVANKTKAYVSISCPNYQEALKDLPEKEIFTHMLRGPTNQELGK
jgi:hypothetical protein